jgi:hypothetical protein
MLFKEDLEHCMINGLADYNVARLTYGNDLSYVDFVETCIDWGIPYVIYPEEYEEEY